jgi:hypothetical protein
MKEIKRFQWIILLLATCFVFGGCPYESSVPIDEPSVKIDSGLLGTWNDSQNKNDSYDVTKEDDYTYKIVKKRSDSDEVENYLAYESVINGNIFLNIWEIKEGEESHSFSLYKMEVETVDKITLSEVTENIDEQFSNSEQLKKFITAGMKNSYFFSKEETVLVRPGN